MILTGGTVQPPSNISFSDGAEVGLVCGKTAELVVTAMHGNLYTQTYQGRMFHGYSTTAAAIPISSTTTPAFALYNPRSSGVNCVLVNYQSGWVSGTNVEGTIMLGVATGMPGAPATGAALTAFTAGPVTNGMLGSGKAPQARFGVGATLAAAATQFFPIGLTNMKLANNVNVSYVMFYDFNGTVIVPPGVMVFSCATAATVATYVERITWYEFPV